MQIIKANQVTFEKNLDGTKTVSMTKGSGLNNHTVQNMFMPGIEINPADGEKLVITPIAGSNSYMVAIAGANENIVPDCARGERKIYSVSPDGQEIKAVAKFKNDGNLILNNGTLDVARKTDTTETEWSYDAPILTPSAAVDLETWINLMTTAVNALAPGTIVALPAKPIPGKITSGNQTIKC